MRKATMLVSLASILFLGVGVVIQAFSVPIGLPGVAWSWLPGLPLLIGILLTMASFALWTIYCWFQQAPVMKRQLKKLRIVARSDLELFRSKRAEVNPYKREAWLRFFVKVSVPPFMTMPYVIDLLMRLSHQLSYQQLQQLQMTTQPVCLLLTSTSIFIYIILGTDFTKKSKAKTKD